MALKERISSPLEAGVSVLDAYHLPSHLHPALEYASNRLARKSLHITLVVVRRDYQLPSIVRPLTSPTLDLPPTPTAPPAGRFDFSTPLSTIKQLVRTTRGTPDSTVNTPKSSSFGFSPPALESPTFSTRSPLSPSFSISTPPMTPSTLSSATSANPRSQLPGNSFGMRLVYASGLPVRAKRSLEDALQKAKRKFNVGSEWLSPVLNPAACGFSNQLIRSSVAQQQVLYSSEGLTLVSLDRLYSVKSALASYTRTRSRMRLEDAVDELRRYILANNGCKISKADLLRAYDWLGVTNASILDLDSMYRRAYGGPDEVGGIAGMPSRPPAHLLEPRIKLGDEDELDFHDEDDVLGAKIRLTAPPKSPLRKPATPKGPLLKLQTNFESPRAVPCKIKAGTGVRNHDFTLDQPPVLPQTWNPFSIDEILGTQTLGTGDVTSPSLLSPIQGSRIPGPLTPNGYDDISPITRGEWGMLLGGSALQSGRMAAIETC
ncbi:hypothetical protein S40293_08424 [Stachybotrys chartarum IBT 40293]|nr:hypothetical protein S40293_08424 [Stachybotrys chartarum IBT 40293]